ncbi:MAG: hypothetical protein JWR69_4323 [Pedosphaera sp.]|nr:hypothetical protein [Pedosphaera sp.]
MKTKTSTRTSEPGYALLLVMVFLGLSLLLLTGILSWTSQNVRDTDRGNEYYTSASAAEAATEKVLVRMARDYIQNGESAVINNLTRYRTNYPTTAENAYWGNYSFTNPKDGSTGTWVANSNTSAYAVLNGQYSGLSGYRSTYYISSDAGLINSRYGITARVGQWIGLEAIPLFQFAIFYNMDLEIEPGAPMLITGRVHSNSNIWVHPGASLTFASDTTASGVILTNTMPADPRGNGGLTNITIGWSTNKHVGGNSSLNLPIGTNNSPDNVFEVLNIAPGGESPNSALGTNRYYNKADLIIIVSNTTVSVTSGVNVDNKTTTIPTNQWSQFLTTTNTFYDGRELSNVRVTQLDVGKFRTWAQSATNPIAAKLAGKTIPNIVYIADERTSVSYESGVRLVNGARLPDGGLTVATPNPVYIKGDYNTTSDGVNFSKTGNTTTYTRPASVLGDAITILSSQWSDGYGTSLNHPAVDTTINAALVSGIVPTDSSAYSGGVENFARFLENWNGHKSWYNGSMVVLFNSRTATAPWRPPGSGSGSYYDVPTRNWAFDKNFNIEANLPPGTPRILFVERQQWAFRDRNSP